MLEWGVTSISEEGLSRKRQGALGRQSHEYAYPRFERHGHNPDHPIKAHVITSNSVRPLFSNKTVEIITNPHF